MDASAATDDTVVVEATGKAAPEDATKDEVAQHEAPKGDDDAVSAAPPPPAPSQSRICVVCEKEDGKYKCPRCLQPYCSVACNKKHLENHPPDLPRPAKPVPQPDPRELAEKKRKAHPFSVLEDSPELRLLFKKYPSLPRRLEQIHAATLPPKNNIAIPKGGLPRNLQQTAAFRKPQNWTHDTGLKRGKEALRRARTDPGEDGEGVREYCELVLHLLSKAEKANVTDMVRQEVTAEDVQLIQQLIEAEGR